MAKIDLVKEFKEFYKPTTKQMVIVDVPEFNFLMIDGMGDPATSQDYKDAIEALYAVAYTLKFLIKKGPTAVDYGVMPLEGLWWADDVHAFANKNRDAWKWTAMIMQPKFVTSELFKEAVEQVKKKKNPAALPKIRLEPFKEGLSAQIMYLGPYSGEGPTIQKLHDFIRAQGGELHGKHHEIYMSDPRRTAPEKLKTVIRQPMKK